MQIMIPGWSQWDVELEYVKLDGPFVVGAKGKLKPVGGPEISFRVTELELLKHFSDVSYLPLTKLIFRHWITPQAGKIIVRQRVEMKGFLAPFFAIVIGRKIKAHMPAAMKKLVEYAERESR